MRGVGSDIVPTHRGLDRIIAEDGVQQARYGSIKDVKSQRRITTRATPRNPTPHRARTSSLIEWRKKASRKANGLIVQRIELKNAVTSFAPKEDLTDLPKRKWAQRSLGLKNAYQHPHQERWPKYKTPLHSPTLPSCTMSRNAGEVGQGQLAREDPSITKGRKGFTQLSEMRERKLNLSQTGLLQMQTAGTHQTWWCGKRKPIPGENKPEKRPRPGIAIRRLHPKAL